MKIKRNFLEKESVQHYWIGGKRSHDNSKFTWYQANQVEMHYQSWYPREPNNQGGHENCVEFVYDRALFGWNDINCMREFYVMCEQSV